MSNEAHICSGDLCARCKYAKCEQRCMFGGHCPLYSVFGCRCDLIIKGAPCPHFKEVSEDGC